MSAHGKELGYAANTEARSTFKSEKADKPDLPFDLDNLVEFNFNFTHTFDQLKMAIEYLARQQGDMQILINELLARPEPTHTIIEKQNTII